MASFRFEKERASTGLTWLRSSKTSFCMFSGFISSFNQSQVDRIKAPVGLFDNLEVN